jgi:hypothetical protein
VPNYFLRTKEWHTPGPKIDALLGVGHERGDREKMATQKEERGRETRQIRNRRGRGSRGTKILLT